MATATDGAAPAASSTGRGASFTVKVRSCASYPASSAASRATAPRVSPALIVIPATSVTSPASAVP